jgi:PAS domain S-box-containing protein
MSDASGTESPSKKRSLRPRTAEAEFHFNSNEELYRILYEDSPSMYFTLDRHGTVLSVNHFGAEQLGYAVEELVGRSVLAVFHEEDHAAVQNQLALLLEQPGQARHWQLRKVRKDGIVIWVEEDARAVLRNDSTMMVLVVCTDISELKRAEEELRDSRQHYKLLVDHATDIIYRIDTMGCFTFVNPTATRLTGYAEPELLGRHFTEFIRPDYRVKAMRFYWRQLVRKIRTTYFEFPALAKDGREIWFGQNVQLMQEEGRITGLFSVTRDITERKRAEQALAASEKRLKTILETEPECVKVVTEDCLLLDMNPAGLKMVEAARLEDLCGRSVLPIIAPAHRDAFAEFTRRVHAGQPGVMQFEIVGLKGSRRWVETHAVPLRNERNNTVGVLGVTRDITERNRAEEALHAARQEREQLARNLHDNIIQSIYAIGFTLEECQTLLKGAPTNANRKLDQVIAELNRIIREVRGYLITPAKESEMLSTDELIASLQRVGGLMERTNGMRFTFAIDRGAADLLTAGQRAQFLYVAQEAMSNSLRHSGASTAGVSLASTPTGIRLEILDSGVGFALQGIRNGSGGLRNIRVRARRIGANLDIMSKPMEGTVISMEIPANGHHDNSRKV